MAGRYWAAALATSFSAACAGGDMGCGAGPARVREPSHDSVVHWRPPLDVATGRAFAGPWQMNESDFDYVDDATVALADDGSLAVAWADNARKDVFFQALAPDGTPRLSAPTNVSSTPAVFSWLPRVVMSDSQVFALWQEIVFSGGSHGGEIFFSRSLDSGASFSAPLNLSRSMGGDGKGRLSREHWDNGSLDLVRDAAGTLLATWTEYDGALWFASSGDAGQSFSAPVRVGGSEQLPARGPSICRAPSGNVYIAWASGESGQGTLLYAVSRDAGRSFDTPQRVLTSGGRLDAPKLGVDERGTLHLVYGERSTEAAPGQVRYARFRELPHALEAPRTLGGANGGASASFPSLSVAAPGLVVVAWLYHPAGGPPRGLELTLSRDGGSRFSAPELVPGTSDASLGISGSRQGKLMRVLATNGSGTLALTSSHFREGQSSRIRAIVGRTR